MRFPRLAGILLHPTSLPGGNGIGELGESAYRFVEFLVDSGQSLWQILPLGPTGYGDSPYACFSAMAGNPMLINLSWLASEGDVDPSELTQAPAFPETHVDFGPVISFKTAILQRAARAFRRNAHGARRDAFEAFCQENASWLDDFALFMALKSANGGAVWNTWEWGLVSRDPATLDAWRKRLDETVFAQKYAQFQFFRQWHELKAYANSKGVQIIGDVPIFVAYDSVDVWAHPELFFLDENLLPTRVAGVPPDYFSPTGQLWGNPLYRWDLMAKDGFGWWIQRIEQTFRTVDILRLDHFRGFAAYWEVPAGEPTAVKGKWTPAPGTELFQTLAAVLGELPIIAEDLGLITPDVEELRDRFAFPGMHVLQFGFTDEPTNPHLPHNLLHNSVIYTGTHDNDTTVGWYKTREGEELGNLRGYLGPADEDLHWAMIRLAYRSVADLAIVPLQDVLGLGSEARMNTPGKVGGNWTWRFGANDIQPAHASRLSKLTQIYGRQKVEAEPEIEAEEIEEAI